MYVCTVLETQRHGPRRHPHSPAPRGLMRPAGASRWSQYSVELACMPIRAGAPCRPCRSRGISNAQPAAAPAESMLRTRSSRRALQCCRRLLSSSATPTPVVVAGAGPSGLVTSCLLSAYGVEHVVVEKAPHPTQHPQAHFINNRSMEVFRGLGRLAAEVAQQSPPLSEWRSFVYCSSLSGQVLGRVDHFPGQASAHQPDISPEAITHLSQHRLVPLLLEQAQSAQHSSCSRLLWGHKLLNITRNPEAAAPFNSNVASAAGAGQGRHVAPLAVHLQGPSGQPVTLHCQYLVAADGAHSMVRNLLGIRMSGEPAMQHLINIHFSSPQLGQQLLAGGRPAMLYFVFNRQVVSVIVAHHLQQGEFVAQVPYFPPMQSLEDFTPEVCQQLLAAAAGVPQLPITIHQVKSWVMSALVADQYAGLDNRVFLVGDSAHRFPPAGGFGMNTGIQDAHNLAWKLAAVLKGYADPQLLASYEQERRPVALDNTALSVANWQEAVRVPAALGLDPRLAGLLHKAAAAAPLPASLSKGLLEAGLALGRSVAAAVTPIRAQAVQTILSVGDSLRLQFPKEDLGFCYAQGAVLQQAAAGNSSESKSSSSSYGGSGRARGGTATDSEQPGGYSRGQPYIPSTQPGCRLPHVELQLLPSGGKRSSLDFVGPRCGLSWLLVISTHVQAEAAAAAAEAAAAAAAAGAKAMETAEGAQTTALNQAPSEQQWMAWAESWLTAGVQLQQCGWPLNTLHILTVQQQQQQQLSMTSVASAYASWVAVDKSGTWEQLWEAVQQDGKGSMAASMQDSFGADTTTSSSSSQTWVQIVLVRPDGHVAWRHQHAAPEAPQQQQEQGESSAACLLRTVLQRLHQHPVTSAPSAGGGAEHLAAEK